MKGTLSKSLPRQPPASISLWEPCPQCTQGTQATKSVLGSSVHLPGIWSSVRPSRDGTTSLHPRGPAQQELNTHRPSSRSDTQGNGQKTAPLAELPKTNLAAALPKAWIFNSHLDSLRHSDILPISFFCCCCCCCLFACFFRATPAAYGSSQVRAPIGAAAAGLHHRHNNAGSEPYLRPAPQLMAMLES